MATLAYGDLLKRDNVSVFTNRLAGKGAFQLRDEKSPPINATGRVTVTQNNKVSMFDGNFTEGSLRAFLETKSGSDNFEIELMEGSSRRFHRITKIYKDREFGGVASKAGGQGSERQDSGLVQAINEAVARHEKATVPGISGTLKSAYKKEGLSAIGKEPYIDIIVETERNKFGVSCKDESAPSLAGGGVAGIKLVAPDLVPKVYAAIERYLRSTMRLKQNDVVPADSIPDFFILIPDRYVEIILRGTARMGGPVSHMYIGKMDVVSDSKREKLVLNGKFFTIKEYMSKIGKFYFRVRKRDIDPTNTVQIDYMKVTTEGFKVLMKAPSTNKNNVRIVITDKVPTTGKILRIS